ncbi:MAG: hypothetical protein Alis3KO_28410 [Aliiglaciecola sp.]
MKLQLILILCATLLGCAAQDADTTASNSCEGMQCMSDEEKKRAGYQCKAITVTGSRLPVKQCTTASQREEARKAAKKMVDKMQQQGQGQEVQ